MNIRRIAKFRFIDEFRRVQSESLSKNSRQAIVYIMYVFRIIENFFCEIVIVGNSTLKMTAPVVVTISAI